MYRVFKELMGIGNFYDSAQIHYSYPAAYISYGTQPMGYKYIC